MITVLYFPKPFLYIKRQIKQIKVLKVTHYGLYSVIVAFHGHKHLLVNIGIFIFFNSFLTTMEQLSVVIK